MRCSPITPSKMKTSWEVAEEAMHQSRLFQKEALLLLVTCAKFLKPKLKDAKSILKYIEENEDKKEVVFSLLSRMNRDSKSRIFQGKNKF